MTHNYGSQVTECLARVGEEQKRIATSQENSDDFAKEIGVETLDNFVEQLRVLEANLHQERNELSQRKEDAETYAARSRVWKYNIVK